MRHLATVVVRARSLALACLSASALALPARAEEPRGDLRVGVLVAHQGRAILAADGAELLPGTEVHPAEAGAIARFRIGERVREPAGSSPEPLILVGGAPAATYNTAPPRPGSLEMLPLLVVLGRPAPPGLTVSSCTSREGVHISLWSGSGERRVRRWSAYLYLGYDTEPTCAGDELAP